jgi:hypothetical protein
MKEDLVFYKEFIFMQVFFFRISKLHINKFDIGLKQTHSEEIQVIHMDRFS